MAWPASRFGMPLTARELRQFDQEEAQSIRLADLEGTCRRHLSDLERAYPNEDGTELCLPSRHETHDRFAPLPLDQQRLWSSQEHTVNT